MLKDNIKQLRLNLKLSQQQFAERLHVTQGAVSQWESGRTMPDTALLLSMASEFNVPLSFLNSDSQNRDFESLSEARRKPDSEISFPWIPIKPRAVPIIGEIACGTPITAEQNIEGYSDLPEGIHADFALRCKGDSMEPTFSDGDLVLIRRQPDVENGQIAAVLIDGEATLKHVYKESDGLLLVADNAQYAPIHLKESEMEYTAVQGLAIGYARMFYDQKGKR